MKWKRNEVDDAFYQYMNKAIQVGPQDAIVHKFIVEYGLANYAARSPEYIKVIQLLKHHMKLGLINPHSRDAIVQSIASYNVEEPACRWMRLAAYPVRKRIPNCITIPTSNENRINRVKPKANVSWPILLSIREGSRLSLPPNSTK